MMEITMGKRVKELRLHKNITQVELAKGICTPSMISQIEADRAQPSYRILLRIAERLGVSIDRIVSDLTPDMEPYTSFRLARAMVSAKEYTDAVPMLKELLHRPHPQVPMAEVRYHLGDCYLETGRLKEADREFQEVYEATLMSHDHLLSCRVLNKIGQLLIRRKRYPVAIYHWEKALGVLDKMEIADPLFRADLQFQIGQAHLKLGSTEQAMQRFEQAGQVYQDNEHPLDIAKSYAELGRSFKQAHDYQQADAYAGKAVAVFGMWKELYTAIQVQVQCAVQEAATGRAERAVGALQRAIGKFEQWNKLEDVGLTYLELAKAYLHLEQPEQAEEARLQAMSLLDEHHPARVWGRWIEAQILRQRGRYEEAASHMREAAAAFQALGDLVNWEMAVYELSRICGEQGDYQQACAIMEQLRAETWDVFSARGIAL